MVRCLALTSVMRGLHTATQPWKPIAWSSRYSFCAEMNSSECLDLFSSGISRALETWWPRSDLLLCGWVAAVPKYFYIPIIPLTADPEISGRDEISWTAKVASYELFLSSSEHQNKYLMFVNADCLLCAWFYTHVAMGQIEIHEFSN